MTTYVVERHLAERPVELNVLALVRLSHAVLPAMVTRATAASST